MDNQLNKHSQFLFYQGQDGHVKIQVILGDETIWATQASMAEIFETTKQNISYHLSNIFKEGELIENSVVKEILTTASDGKQYSTNFYNLDAIISVGYRVSSPKATEFRIWATSVIKEYLIKGFALDDERLKQGKEAFGKDYFDELLERIREIRASERRFYQKITDIYAQCSIDYDPHSQVTQQFYATVQNKLHFAISHHTAAGIIAERANASKPNMGLTSWKNAQTTRKILKTDVVVAKNYLSADELDGLNRIVSMYLDFAENLAKRQKAMKMTDWVQRLDSFLQLNEYDLINDAGQVSAKVAKQIAEKEFEKFRVIQDKTFVSDFDRVVEGIKTTGKLPVHTQPTPTVKVNKTQDERALSTFDQNLKRALDYNPKGYAMDEIVELSGLSKEETEKLK